MTGKTIGIIGCGNMGEALISRLTGKFDKKMSLIASDLDIERMGSIQKKYNVRIEESNSHLVQQSDIVILAIKPKDFDNVLKEDVMAFMTEDKILISIAAGITTKFIEGIVGKDTKVLRVMPNMAAFVGEAISTVSKGISARDEEIVTAKEIFSVLGDVVEVKEDLVDSITAIAGSGPAYFFYFIQALIEAAKGLGLDEELAKRLVLKTALGSVKLLEILKEEPEALIKKVASKGGTTESALKVFESKGLKRIVKDACHEAQKRAKEISGR
ncbi:MAG: pyrroline-5-carboxylate reductase [Omnitrophica bacterium RIFCSPLOWO2_01_FULL_45_10]|nr:MAG: pyrroline-5-carboxylate reductase [Omnitrophica bacterium RIFCSPLOWO2_01_FULL_45_10]